MTLTNLLVSLVAAVTVHHAAPNYEVPLSSVTAPSQCTATYAHAFVVPSGGVLTGTSSNDLIFAGYGSSIHAGDGNDCLVSDGGAGLKGEGGDDIFVSTVSGANSIDGGAGNDTAYYRKGFDGIKNVENAINQ